MPFVDAKKTAEARRGKSSSGDRTWWTAPPADVARRLAAWCDNIERGNWSKRWANLVFYRYITGRPTAPTSFNYSPSARPTSVNVYSRAQFESPRYNVLKQCSDGIGARVYKERPFIQVCPIAGDNKTRVKSKKLSRWLDAAFFEFDLWPIVEQCGEDARTWGSAFLWIEPDPLLKLPKIVRVLQDEIIIDENETNAGEPRRLAIRIFVNKDEMLAAYGKTPEAREAIENAPRANNGLYFGNDVDYTNVIVLRKAWSLPLGDEPGRAVLTVGDHCIDDTKWTRKDFPISKLYYSQVSTSWFGMGMPEQVLGLQREVDRVMAAIWENVRRASWPRILLGAGSNVNPGALGDKSNGIVTYTGVKPEFIYPEAISQDMFRYLEDTIRRIKETFRMNDQATMGSSRRELTGVAIEKAEVVDDAAHLPQLQHLEDFVVDIGMQLIKAAEVCHPTVKLPGRSVQEIKWEEVKIAESSYTLRPFPVGRLSKDMATRQKQIDGWYAQGKISKGTSMRLEQIPDVDGFLDLVNASRDYVEAMLDKMVEDGDYEPPTGLEDLAAAHEVAQSRYLQEKLFETPQDRLDMIMKYIVAVEQLMDEAAPQAAPGRVGIQPPAGAPMPGPNGMGGVPLPPTAAVPLAA